MSYHTNGGFMKRQKNRLKEKSETTVETKEGQRVRSSNRAQLYEGEWVLSDPGDK